MALHAFRLHDGDELYEGIERFVNEKGIRAGFLTGGAAGLSALNVRLASTPEQPSLLTREGRFEVVSLIGTTAVGALHIHIAVADEHGRVIGGHLMPTGNPVRLSAELGIVEGEGMTFSRVFDPDTNYKELTIHES
jgi:uncharacterized protein